MSNLWLASTMLIASLTGAPAPGSPLVLNSFGATTILAQKEMDLTRRQKDPHVNQVFSDNILIYLHYLKGDANAITNKQLSTDNQKVMDLDKVRESFSFALMLRPGEVLTFHPDVLPKFQDKPYQTAPTTFKSTEGYRFVAGLWANGVCHLASLINWAAQEAGLKVTAKVNHDFAPIPGVPREFGTAIYYMEGSSDANQQQNLYLENIYDFPVTLNFTITETKVIVTVTYTPTLTLLPPAL